MYQDNERPQLTTFAYQYHCSMVAARIDGTSTDTKDLLLTHGFLVQRRE